MCGTWVVPGQEAEELLDYLERERVLSLLAELNPLEVRLELVMGLSRKPLLRD